VKRVGSRVYLHRGALHELTNAQQQTVEAAADHLLVSGWDIVRLNLDLQAVMFGWTTSWDTDPHPKLQQSQVVHKVRGRWVAQPRAHYKDRPVYHRKDLMVAKDHPDRELFAKLTRQEADAGLLGRPDIGRESSWERLLEQEGWKVVGHRLVRR